MASPNKCNLTIVLNLTMHNSHTLKKSGDSSFEKEWGFKHTTSSSRFPQSHREVEHGVKTVKNLLSKEKDPAKGFLAYRSTPLACKFSPAWLLMGGQIRNSVPVFHTQLNLQWPDLENLHERESMSKLNHKQCSTTGTKQSLYLRLDQVWKSLSLLQVKQSII